MSASSKTYKTPSNDTGKLKSVPGAPNIQETLNLNKVANEVTAANNYETVHGAVDRDSNEFPLIPFAKDTYDDIAAMKTQFGQVANVGGNWVVPFDQQDANYLLRKRAQVEQADFDRWLYQKYDLTDPAQMFLFQQIAPEQFQRRQEVIDYQQNLVSRYAKLRLRGPKNLSDLQFEWLIETGRIELPKGPIWSPKEWMWKQEGLAGDQPDDFTGQGALLTQSYNAWSNRYRKGLFSILRIPDQTSVGWKANAANRADIRGNPSESMTWNLMQNKDFSDALPNTLYGKQANNYQFFRLAPNANMSEWSNVLDPDVPAV